jgi:hypothetical protein
MERGCRRGEGAPRNIGLAAASAPTNFSRERAFDDAAQLEACDGGQALGDGQCRARAQLVEIRGPVG